VDPVRSKSFSRSSDGKADSIIGYTSTASLGLHKKLLEPKDGWSIHNRVLGNVSYFMTSQTSTPEQIKQLEERILESIE